jgi:branched-chain amino acid transport system substrate-binding protein
MSLMSSANVPRTSFSEGGYLAATLFVDVLKGIKGEIDRASVTTALREMKPIDTPMIGTPYTFGMASQHAPNSSSKFVQLREGKWEVQTSNFVKLPD